MTASLLVVAKLLTVSRMSKVDYWNKVLPDVLNSYLNSHSDSTHLLQKIHCYSSDVMQNISKYLPKKKQTCLHLERPKGDYIFSKFLFLGDLFLYFILFFKGWVKVGINVKNKVYNTILYDGLSIVKICSTEQIVHFIKICRRTNVKH